MLLWDADNEQVRAVAAALVRGQMGMEEVLVIMEIKI